MSYDRGRGPPSIEGMTSLKVDNLTYRTTVDDLKKVFRAYGDVGDVYIPRDARTNQSRGFAFVRFYERRDAEDAMDRVDGSVLDGREIRVQHAKYGRPQSDYRRGSGGRDRGYNDRSRGRRSHSPRRRRSRSYSPRRRSRSPRSRRSRSRSPRRRASRSPEQDRRRGSGSPSPKRTSQSPERNGSPSRNRKSSSPEKSS